MSRSTSPDLPVLAGWAARLGVLAGLSFLLVRVGFRFVEDVVYELGYVTSRERHL